MNPATALVLVIEDDALIRANLTRWLKIEGYRVDIAEDGTQGLALARQTPPDVVICDLRMPGIDGYGVLAQLRAVEATAKVPFILLTASADQTERLRSYQQGDSHFMKKPFDLKELGELIKTCVRHTAG